MSSKVHSQGNVPFSWEYRPGESKAAPPQDRLADHVDDLFEPPKSSLPPPSCPPEHPRVSFHDMPIPLPPRAFSPSFRSSSKKGTAKKSDDPFLIAYKEVTKNDTTTKGKFWSADRISGVRPKPGLKINVDFFTCKQSSSVLTEDSMLKLPQIPNSRLLRREADHD